MITYRNETIKALVKNFCNQSIQLEATVIEAVEALAIIFAMIIDKYAINERNVLKAFNQLVKSIRKGG